MIRLFNVSVPPATFILLISEALLFSGAFVIATFVVGDLDPTDYLLYNYGIVALALVVLSFVLGMHFHDLYTQIRVTSRVLLVQRLCMVAGIAFLTEGLISYLYTDLRVSVRIMVVGSAIAMPCVFLWRLWFGNFAGHLIGHTRLVFAGRSATLAQLRKWIGEHPEAGLLVEAAAENAEEWKTVEEVVRVQQPPKVVFGAPARPDPALTAELVDLQLAGYQVEAAAVTYEKAAGRISVYSLVPQQLIYSSAFEVSPQTFFYQLTFNGVLAAIAFAITLPLVAMTGLLLGATRQGPIWLRQDTVGLHGRIFRMYRFRCGGSGVVARTVRKLRLHKLPLLWNVIKGDMAIVGPCPDRPEYLSSIERYLPFYRERYSVRPGMTGWAQIHLNGTRDARDVMAELEYDLYYIKHISLGLDTLILLHTIKQIVMSPPAGVRAWTAEQVSSASTN
jgi:lipopolysaccharide/colanic/teichoic acid biosynthesis glycosyltransferase